MGTLTATLTWGVFGLVAGGLKSLALWAILGALCGGLWAFYTEHLLTKNELVRIGTELPADSSSLIMFVETRDSRRVLERTASAVPKTGSVASIGDDLSACVFAGPNGPIEVPSSRVSSTSFAQQSPESMVLLRYPNPGTARDVARRTTPKSKKEPVAVRVEAVIWADSNGRRHVADPSQGVAAWAKSDIVSWGLFGVVVGALAGALGGGGVHAFVHDTVVTGLGWALFGLIAGALYGLWAGRAVSARRIKRLRRLLPAGRSMLVAWADEHARQADVDALTTAGSERLIVRFNPVPGGAVLEAI
jgi:outer membrane lipoprotein SlyB